MSRGRSKPSPQVNQLALAGIVTVMLGFAAVSLGMMITKRAVNADKPETQSMSLEEGKKKYPTKLVNGAPAQEPFKTDVPSNATAVYYYSNGQKLLAWLIVPKSIGKHPVILFAHSAFALDMRDYSILGPFYHAGYALMVPAWRGENGNPGSFELCFGEVDDAKAAVQFLKERPDIDSSHIYAAGLDQGGTLVMLLAEECSDLRKAAAYGAYPDMLDGGTYDHPPFEENSAIELDLRSPGNHVKDLKCPLSLFYAANDEYDKKYEKQAEQMVTDAKAAGKNVQLETITGYNHREAVVHVIPRMLDFFQAN